MGDIGGAAQAGASMADTAMTDATNVILQKQAQAFNSQQAGIQRDWSAGQAALQRNFENTQQLQAEKYNTQMSDTAVQRRSEDIRQAGFNPLLAVSQLGGASSPQMSAPSAGVPSGATASSPAPAQVQGLISNAAQLNLTNAQAAAAHAQAKKTQSETPAPRQNAVDPDTGEVTVNASPGHELGDANLGLIKAETGLTEDQAFQVKRTVDLIGEQIYQTGTQAAVNLAQASLAGANEAVVRGTLQAVIQTAQNEARIGKARSDIMGDPKWGPVIVALQAMLPAVSSAVGAASKLRGLP